MEGKRNLKGDAVLTCCDSTPVWWTPCRVGSSKKLWTPDENEGEWKHDMWEQLQKEEAGERPNFSNWNRGRRPGRYLEGGE